MRGPALRVMADGDDWPYDRATISSLAREVYKDDHGCKQNERGN